MAAYMNRSLDRTPKILQYRTLFQHNFSRHANTNFPSPHRPLTIRAEFLDRFGSFLAHQTGPNAPKTLSEIDSLQEVLASSTLPQKSSKNAIVYSERHLELEQVRHLLPL